jgi:C-terminal processing protease CtpA/Prc
MMIYIAVTEFVVRVPAGALGVVLETTDGGVPSVDHIYSNSLLADRVRLGDWLVAVDGRNVTSINVAAVSRLIASKKDNAVRELIFARPK